jgi:hypothetical protein
MKNRRITQVFLILVCVTLFVSYGHAQGLKDIIGGNAKELSMKTVTLAPYLEVEKGKYMLFELGFEAQIKKLQLKGSRAHGISGGLNYDFKNSNFGYDLAYWFKPNWIGFTFGGNFGFRSDLNSLSSFGIAPTMGFQFWMLHAQAGFYLWTQKPAVMNTNTVFVSLKFAPVFSKKRTIKKGGKTIFSK